MARKLLAGTASVAPGAIVTVAAPPGEREEPPTSKIPWHVQFAPAPESSTVEFPPIPGPTRAPELMREAPFVTFRMPVDPPPLATCSRPVTVQLVRVPSRLAKPLCDVPIRALPAVACAEPERAKLPSPW